MEKNKLGLTIETIAKGEKFTICEIQFNGKSTIQKFIKRLEQKQKAAIIQLIKSIAKNGNPEDDQKLKFEEEGIFALKRDQVRIYCFFHKNNLILLTNGSIKKSRKANPNELKRAKDIKKQFLNSIGN